MTIAPPYLPPPPTALRPPPPDNPLVRTLVPVAWAGYAGLNTFSALLLPRSISQEAARQAPLLIDPAGYAFSIWFPIFVGQGAYAIYQATPAGRRNPRVAAARGPMLASFAFGALWPVAVAFQRLDVANVILFGMLGTGIVAYRRLRPAGAPAADREESLAARVPTSAYVGWLTIAGLVSATGVAVNQFGARPLLLPAVAWAALGIGAAGAAAAAVGYAKRDSVYAAAIAWGLVAIAVEQQPPAIPAAVAGAVVLAAAGVVAGLRRRRA